MKITKNSFWFVKYKGKNSYTGCVFVKEWNEYDKGWSTILAKSYREKYINYLSGSLFKEKDFVRPATKDDFFKQRYEYLKKELKRCISNRM